MVQATFASDSVTSRDGTSIDYRRFGEGPAIVAIHGGMQAAQNFTKLALALSDSFTVFVPNRRGRGRSGPHGANYSLTAECEDMAALVVKTGAHNLFGLSSGAIISLQVALMLPTIRKVAVYEPPLSVEHSVPTDWVARFDREIAQGRIGQAMVTALRGTKMAPPLFRYVPRPVLAGMLHAAMRQSDDSNQEIPRQELVPTMHYDVQLAIDSEGRLESFKGLCAEVLLLGGTKSPAYLKTALDALSRVLRNATRVEFPGLDHVAPDNDGSPERVAESLREFFA